MHLWPLPGEIYLQGREFSPSFPFSRPPSPTKHKIASLQRYLSYSVTSFHDVNMLFTSSMFSTIKVCILSFPVHPALFCLHSAKKNIYYFWSSNWKWEVQGSRSILKWTQLPWTFPAYLGSTFDIHSFKDNCILQSILCYNAFSCVSTTSWRLS